MRKTIQDLNIMKAKKDKIIALTSYDYQTADILDDICDLILVGDSLGNVFQGKETTSVSYTHLTLPTKVTV